MLKKSPLKPIHKKYDLNEIISKRTFIEPLDVNTQLKQISHLRLDREQLKSFDLNLEEFTNITHLYLQHNLLTTLELSSQNLYFLCASSNSITLLKLNTPRLIVLDVENNLLTDVSEFPESLEFLNLKGNPLCSCKGYRGEMLKKFRNLKELDNVSLSHDLQEESEVYEESLDVDYTERVQMILQRSKQRQLSFLKK